MSPSDFYRSSFFLGNPWVRVKNSAADTISPHSVVLPGTPTITNNAIVIPVSKPNAASTDFIREYLVTGPFAIGASSNYEGIATTMPNPGLVRYDSSGTPAAKDVWGAKHDQYTLTKDRYGFYIYGGNTTSAGNNVIVAKQIGVHQIVGKIDDTDVTLDGTCTVSVWDAPGSNDISCNVTGVRNRTVDLTSVANKFCAVGWMGDEPYLMWVRCG